MRLRSLTEAECYTRCYGGKPGERVSVVRVLSRREQREQREQEAARRGRRRAA